MAPSGAEWLAKAKAKYDPDRPTQEKPSSGWLPSWLDSRPKFREAAELYEQAGIAFRAKEAMKESGDAFMKQAKCRMQEADFRGSDHEAVKECKDEALNAYYNAAKAYKQQYPTLAIEALTLTCSILGSLGQFRQAGDKRKEIGKIQLDIARAIVRDLASGGVPEAERELAHDQAQRNMEDGATSMEQAAEMYRKDSADATANGCAKDAADLRAELRQFDRAVDLYDRVADYSIGNNLLKYSVKDYWLRSGLCAIATKDLYRARQAIQNYASQDRSFFQTREFKFLNQILETVEAGDLDAFDAAYNEYNLVQMDDVKQGILMAIRESLNEGPQIT